MTDTLKDKCNGCGHSRRFHYDKYDGSGLDCSLCHGPAMHQHSFGDLKTELERIDAQRQGAQK